MDNSSLWNPNLPYRLLYDGIMRNYPKKINEKWYYTDIKEIAKENKIANWIVKTIRSSTHQTKDRYKGMYKVLIMCRHCLHTMVIYCNSLISSQKNLT